MRTIRGKRALVTGAASGIGRAIALALAQEGADLFLIDIDESGLAEVARETQSHGVQTTPLRCDVTRPDQITSAVQTLLDNFGGLDILVNNAGIAYYGPTDKMTAEQWDRLMSVNLLAPIQFTRELLPTLLELPEAHILNVCSISGIVAGGRFAAYHTSKFGLIGFTEAIRAEYGRRGLGVTALCPGPVQTGLYKSAMSGRSSRAVPRPPDWICTSVDKVARQAISSIRRNRRMVLVGFLAHVLFNFKRFAPGFLDWMNHLGRKRSKAKVAVAAAPQPVDAAPPIEASNAGRRAA